MASDLPEKANFTRLSRLLIDKGTEALRNTFDGIHPPANLPAVLNASKKSLLRLKFGVINKSQWDLLFPPTGNPPDSKTFDVTLLTVLFRNLCGFTPPSTGWNAIPVDTDRSMQANIARLKFFRNDVYAHVTSTKVDNTTFESLWKKISQALVELKIPKNDIDDLKTCPLGAEEETYVEMLKEWKSREDEYMKMLEGIQCSIEENHDGIKELRQFALEQQSSVEALQSLITNQSHVSKDTNLDKKCNKEGDENLLQKLAKHNFKSKIGAKVKFYHPGTREWLLKLVDGMVEKKQEWRMLLLTAGPGFGKSVFAAKVCEEFKKKGKLAASHFCDFSNSNLRDPMMMLQSLASQMCENIVGFREKLLDQLRRPHKMRNLKDAFRIYLQNPLDELDFKEPCLVVIDGLDESEADDKNEIVNLMADYFPDLPECMKVLVTSRPEISVAKLDSTRIQKINIENNDTKNEYDLERYLKACLPSLPGSVFEDRDVFKVLVRKCEGSFLYAFSVQSELLKRGDLDKITCDEITKFLPEGLNSIYQKYFERLEEELTAFMHKNINVLRILEMLAASKGPLPLDFLTQALGLVPDCRETKKVINKVNEAVSCLLFVSGDMVTVFHKSVIDWLLAKGCKDHEYAVKVSDGNELLCLIYEKVFEEIKDNVCSGHDLNLTNRMKYALYYGPQHLVACKMKERFFWLVDIVIIHALLTAHINSKGNYVRSIFNIWVRILRDAVFFNDKLRARISWHVTEIDYADRRQERLLPFYYLQSILAYSPEGYFSDNEKEIAELLLSKDRQFVEFNFGQADVMPLAVWRFQSLQIGYDFLPSAPMIKAVGLSHDKTMAAVAQWDGTISVITVPGLVKLWHCSTQYKDISCCTFAPDDSFALFGKLETVLNIAERKEVPFFHRNKETFTSCAFSPNGSRLVTSDGSDTVKLWDVAKQSLLSSLRAEFRVNWCSFSNTGLFIIGEPNSKDPTNEESEHVDSEDLKFRTYFSAFCVWNAITWQRSDERNVINIKLNDEKVFHSKPCRRCFGPGFKEMTSPRKLKINPHIPPGYWDIGPCSTGVYNGVECIVVLHRQYLCVVEHSHFRTLAVWNFFVNILDLYRYCHFRKITAIEDDLWFYADMEKLIVFRTKALAQELPCPARVLSSSFSPDGSRLATCTSDGYINIWSVDTSKVEQRFKSSHGDLLFACWWSEKFLFVFGFHRLPSLSKYPVEVNLKILVTASQQVSLSHLVEEFVTFTTIVDFSDGLLSFECRETDPVKVLDISGVGGPQMVTLPGIERRMSITVSPGASFVFGAHEYAYYIWKRNAKEEPAVYEVFVFTDSDEMSFQKHDFLCCFSSDSKVAVVLDRCNSFRKSEIFDLDTDAHKIVESGMNLCDKVFCLNKDRIVIAARHRFLKFFDMDSGVLLESSSQRYLTGDLVKQLKLSPKETVLAFPKINGDMEFRRLCIPQSSSLSSIKREAAIRHENILESRKRSKDTSILSIETSSRFPFIVTKKLNF